MYKKILFIEDDQGLALTVSDALKAQGHRVFLSNNGIEGLAKASREIYDLIIMDVVLPGKDGMTVCRELRQVDKKTPIIMLSGKAQVCDRIFGLQAGADDYITKPFDLMELLARVEARLRLVPGREEAEASQSVYTFGQVKVLLSQAKVFFKGRPVRLSARLYQLLRYFIENRGAMISREQLLNSVWGFEHIPVTRTVDVHVVRLRQKLEENPSQPQYFTTIYGIGYKFLG